MSRLDVERRLHPQHVARYRDYDEAKLIAAEEDLECCVVVGHAFRVPGDYAHCKEVGRSREGVHDLRTSHEAAERKRSAYRLAPDDTVRNDVIMLDTEHLACTPAALLNLFGDEEDAVLLAQLIKFLHKYRVCRQESAVALKRLDDDSNDFLL